MSATALSTAPGSISTMLPEDVQSSPYNYVPTRYVAVIMLVLFGISTLFQAFQASRYKMWWLIPTVCLCGVIELVGWSGRLWSSFSPFADTPFQMEITCTIIAPTPLLAANFVIFAEIIKRLGTQYSRLRPRSYTIIFTTCDVVSLVIQGVGGGIAASANDLVGANKGGRIILGGIVFQVAVIVVYSILAIEYYIRHQKDRPVVKIVGSNEESQKSGDKRSVLTKKLLIMSIALAFNTTLLFTRAIYRTAELSDGWNGKIISKQVLFNVLDGAMIILAMYTMNVAHPGILLASSKGMESTDSSSYSIQDLNDN